MRLGTLPEFREELEDVDSLRRSVAETIEGMDRLLQAERLRKDAVTLKLGPVDLPALADDLLAQVARRAQEKGLRLVNAVPRGCAVHSDRELLTLVLQNLIGNAIKYSASGAVTVGAGEDPDGWFVYVRDEGPGIAPEQQDTLFAAFTRGETHGQSGVGLGLTIASHAARLLGTELAVKSTPGRGATFGLPLTPAEKAEVR
jgi:signal transduction histidine kinase